MQQVLQKDDGVLADGSCCISPFNASTSWTRLHICFSSATLARARRSRWHRRCTLREASRVAPAYGTPVVNADEHMAELAAKAAG